MLRQLYTYVMQKKSVLFFPNAGFTLLELLVVISIIGLLIALGVTSYSTVQKNGRDAKRRSDMKAVQSGLEQYKAANGSYPDVANCAAADITTVLPAGLPSDPKEENNDYYFACSTTAYCACATLENTGSGNASGHSGTDCLLGSGNLFCVENLQ